MPQRTTYEPGTPCWVDVGVPDLEAALAFYTALFGWDVERSEQPELPYAQFLLRGERVAGIGPQENMEAPPFWSVYVSVADADATLAKVEAAGGTVVVGGMDIMDSGRMGVVQDPNGTFISVWQPDQHPGCGLVNEAGTFGWNELSATDLGVARDFYGTVFGWGADDTPSDGDGVIFTVDGRTVCGAHSAGEGEYPAWSVWFGVDDCDASVTRAIELGGSVVMPPDDMGFGRGAMVADPAGAVFGIAAVSDELAAEIT
jgi:predicted enzyme related to lactoylglutathione lyase